MKKIFLSLSLSLCACAVQTTMFEGFDRKGQKRECKPMDQTKGFCTQIFTPEDEFLEKCKERGLKFISCSCHDHLCETAL